ncbi:MAG: hypothetical protein LBH79_04845 [Nitrososphaerota archaeon]|jgi:hypothetical protein|nr:hypothetical protein [Nitrososphaerota archaeon]
METEAAKRILQNLYKRDNIGAKHTSTTNALKGLPKHMRGDAEKILKQLRTLGYITFHPTSYGTQISLNPTKIKEIKQVLGIT